MRKARTDEAESVPGREETKTSLFHASATTLPKDTSPTAALEARPLADASHEERQQDLSTGTAGHQDTKEPDASEAGFSDLILPKDKQEPHQIPLLVPAQAPPQLQVPVQEDDNVFSPSASLDLFQEWDSSDYATSGSMDFIREA
jgi:hypothetical protein